MSDFRIRLSAANQASDELSKISSDLSNLNSELVDIRKQLTMDISSRASIGRRLSDTIGTLDSVTRSAMTTRSALRSIMNDYEKTEKALSNRSVRSVTVKANAGARGAASNAFNIGKSLVDILGWIGGLTSAGNLARFQFGDIGRKAVLEFLKKYPEGSRTCPGYGTYPFVGVAGALIGEFFAQTGHGSASLWEGSGKVETINKIKYNVLKENKDTNDTMRKIDEFEKAHQEKTQSMYYWDPKSGKVAVDPNDKKAKEAFKEHNKRSIPVDVQWLGVGASGAVAGYSASGSTSGSLGGASGSVSLLAVKGNADAYLGSGYVGANIGASVTAFSAEEKAYLGDENTQVYEKVKVEAGKVSAKASGSVGIVDKDGHFNPNAYVGASAEALVGEVTGTVGVKAMGIDASVKGSVNFGVGAHFNAGIHDGKISLDIGASLGVGASVKLDIDVSGAVNAVCTAAQNVGSFIKGLFGW